MKKPAKTGLRVPVTVLERARAKKRRSMLDAFAVDPNIHPPSARPKRRIAMDQAVTADLAWAAGSVFSQVFSEGLEFLGYAYLSELAQRAEYRQINETLATEMTRKWIKIKAKGDADKSEKISKITDEFTRLEVQERFRKASYHDANFGRSHLFVDMGDPDDRDELKKPIGDGQNKTSRAKISPENPIVRLQEVEPVWVYPTDYNAIDPLKETWYRPETWLVQGKAVHRTRLLTFIGREVPDLLKPAYSFGGLSMSQMAKPYVDNWLRTRQSVADLLHAFSVMVLKTDLGQALTLSGEELFRRIQLFNDLRDNRGLMVIDKSTGEEMTNIAVPLGSLDTLQAQTQEHMAAVSHIPIVVLLGIQPAGLNADSEGIMRVWHAWIKAYQELLFRKNLNTLLWMVQLSLFGDVDTNIIAEFEPLRELDAKEMTEKRKNEADTDVELVDAGIISQLEARRRIANDPDTPYEGLDVDDVPEPPEESTEEQDLTERIAREKNA